MDVRRSVSALYGDREVEEKMPLSFLITKIYPIVTGTTFLQHNCRRVHIRRILQLRWFLHRSHLVRTVRGSHSSVDHILRHHDDAGHQDHGPFRRSQG